MKKAELDKQHGSKISGRMKHHGAPGRFGNPAAAAPDRREQRKLDQSLGLVPFAIKLNSGLVKELQALAQSRSIGLNELVAQLLDKGLRN